MLHVRKIKDTENQIFIEIGANVKKIFNNIGTSIRIERNLHKDGK